jgi:ABC-2 type transport system permease protein
MSDLAFARQRPDVRLGVGRGLAAVLERDLKRFWNDRVRVVTGLAQPLLYLFVLGAGLRSATRLGNAYQPYIFPGVVAMSQLFAATFSGITIVFDREWGFLRAVLVAPVSRREIAVAKVLSGAMQGMMQGVLLFVFAPLAGLRPGVVEALEMLGAMLVSALVFSAMGVAVAARFKAAEVFPVVMNAVLLPLFFLSGALYPLDAAPRWLQVLAWADPVAYGVDLMRGALVGTHHFPPLFSLAVLAAGFLLLTWLSVRAFEKGEEL